MEHSRYLPKDDSGRNIWLKNFSSKLPAYATKLNLTPAQVDDIQKASAYFDYVLQLTLETENYKTAIVKYKNLLRDGSENPIGTVPQLMAGTAPDAVPAGIFKRVGSLVALIKLHKNFTESIGKDLGIIGGDVAVDLSTAKPEPKASLKNGHAYLQWITGHAHAADIKADYGNGQGFVTIARITHNHYLDPHLPPTGSAVVYKYMLRYVFKDEEAGEWSGEVSITVTGV